MKYSIGSDNKTHLTDTIVEYCRSQEIGVELHGALISGDNSTWPEVARSVANDVSRGNSDEGILLCRTGTGVTIAANKIPGIRAALCSDAETAIGSRRWNAANVLCLSLRSTSPQVGVEILNAWISNTEIDEDEIPNINKLNHMDKQEVHP